MTAAERRNPKIIDPSRRNRIASGAGVVASDVNQLVKQFDSMAPLMKELAGTGMTGRLQKIRELQASGALDPGGSPYREKKTTGKRLSPKERAKIKKLRDKESRRKKRKK